MQLNRRQFMISGAAATAAVAEEAADEKIFDGGLAPVTEPGIPARKTHLVPPGALSYRNFSTRCVGCQLCVTACPNKVLRPSLLKGRILQPEMGFEHGYCRPECTTCGSVCPSGAIQKITVERKKMIHIGHTIWHQDRCLAAQEGITCNACERHCPAKAIVLVALEPDNPKSPKVPVVDKLRCLGCGACENLCPARPLPAMTLKGFETHREVKPMGDDDVLAEVNRLFEKNKAAVVLVKDGVINAADNGRGLSPILNLHDRCPDDFRGSWVVDKVIGRAAASIAISGGAVRVHASLMSETAQALLKKHNIPCTYDKLVPEILNRDQSGLCPLEMSVKGIDDIDDMLKAIRAKLKELRQKAAAQGSGDKK